jgi:hypothetical protein
VLLVLLPRLRASCDLRTFHNLETFHLQENKSTQDESRYSQFGRAKEKN